MYEQKDFIGKTEVRKKKKANYVHGCGRNTVAYLCAMGGLRAISTV